MCIRYSLKEKAGAAIMGNTGINARGEMMNMSVSGKSLPDLPHFAWLDAAALDRLNAATSAAECGHGGEIRLVIERSLPLHMAWNMRIRERAEALFTHLRVWDTEAQSGVLVYLNLSEQRLELVADEGIARCVAQETWQEMADTAVATMRHGSAVEALEHLLESIAVQLREHYGMADDPAGNELKDEVWVL